MSRTSNPPPDPDKPERRQVSVEEYMRTRRQPDPDPETAARWHCPPNCPLHHHHADEDGRA